MNNLTDVNLLGVWVVGDHLEKQMKTGWHENGTNIADVVIEHGALAHATHAISNLPNHVTQSKTSEQQHSIQQGT